MPLSLPGSLLSTVTYSPIVAYLPLEKLIGVQHSARVLEVKLKSMHTLHTLKTVLFCWAFSHLQAQSVAYQYFKKCYIKARPAWLCD